MYFSLLFEEIPRCLEDRKKLGRDISVLARRAGDVWAIIAARVYTSLITSFL
jgi:hypothetical protein